MTKTKINFNSKLKSISDYWSPKIIAELNDYQFKLAKIKGEFGAGHFVFYFLVYLRVWLRED